MSDADSFDEFLGQSQPDTGSDNPNVENKGRTTIDNDRTRMIRRLELTSTHIDSETTNATFSSDRFTIPSASRHQRDLPDQNLLNNSLENGPNDSFDNVLGMNGVDDILSPLNDSRSRSRRGITPSLRSVPPVGGLPSGPLSGAPDERINRFARESHNPSDRKRQRYRLHPNDLSGIISHMTSTSEKSTEMPMSPPESGASRQPSSSSSDSGSDDALPFVKHRRREPLEKTDNAPKIFNVDVESMPPIDYTSAGVDLDNRVLKQELEFSESESEEESDAGSVAEIIDDGEEESADVRKRYSENEHQEWEADGGEDAEDADGDDDDDDGAYTTSESEFHDSDFDPDVEINVNEARRQKPKRHRIPTVKFWQNERILYETTSSGIMTAVDVQKVKIPKKRYRQRRPYKRRNPLVRFEDDVDMASAADPIHALVFNTETNSWTEKTVATPISNFKFEDVHDANNDVVPLVHKYTMLGGLEAPVSLYLLRIQPGGLMSYASEQNKACAFVDWNGSVQVSMNSNSQFTLQKGMACLVPKGNDLYLENTSSVKDGDVYLFFTEVDALRNPELADALTSDTKNVMAGAAANMFQYVKPRVKNEDLQHGRDGGYSGNLGSEPELEPKTVPKSTGHRMRSPSRAPSRNLRGYSDDALDNNISSPGDEYDNDGIRPMSDDELNPGSPVPSETPSMAPSVAPSMAPSNFSENFRMFMDTNTTFIPLQQQNQQQDIDDLEPRSRPGMRERQTSPRGLDTDSFAAFMNDETESRGSLPLNEEPVYLDFQSRRIREQAAKIFKN